MLDAFSGLVEHSLVAPWATDAPEPRFGMFNMIRAFARDQLDESGEGRAVADRHLELFADLAVAGSAGLQSPEFHELDAAHPSRVGRTCARPGCMRSTPRSGTSRRRIARCAFVCMWVLGRLRELAPLIDATLADDQLGAPTAIGAGCYSAARWWPTRPVTTRSAVAISSEFDDAT